MNREILERLKSNPKTQAAHNEPVPPPQPQPPRKRSPLFLPLFIMLGLTVLAVTGWSAVNSPVLASFVAVSATATPTEAGRTFSAQAVIAKAAYTPTAFPTVILPGNITPEIQAETTPAPGTMLAEIVPDTPTAEYSSSDNFQQPAADASYNGNKYILVDISEQHLYAYENNALVFSFIASTGMNNATAVGHFAVQSKIPNAYGSTWNIWMPDWLGIYWAGGLENGIHALPILPNGGILWEGFLGRPISYGCVVLGTSDAESLYNWADYGTPVEIQR